MIAALFVDKRGPYFGRDDVDPWDVERDARKYPGPHSVVAHPPCQLWVNFAALNFQRYRGEHNRPAWHLGSTSDGGCFAFAADSVRRYGGVLEHPAGTHAFAPHDISAPRGIGWQRSLRADEYVCEVWQSAYGHKARKRTWLFYVGAPPSEMRWNARPGTHQVGWFDRVKPTLGKRDAIKSPPDFADALIALARGARSERKAA